MTVPNRLRDQVLPKSNDAGDTGRDQGWTPRRVFVLAAVLEIALMAAFVLLIGSSVGTVAWLGWLAGHAAMGFLLTSAVDKDRGGWIALAGMLLGAAVAGVGYWVATMIGIAPPPSDVGGLAALAFYVVLFPALVGMFGGPPYGVAALVASVWRRHRVEQRHEAVGSAALAPDRAVAGRESRTRREVPLDDADVGRVTLDGAASTVVLEYPFESDPDQLLADDLLRMAKLGYAIASVRRREPRNGTVWTLARIAAFAVDLLLVRAPIPRLGTWIDHTSEGRVIVTFNLTSPTHAPLPGGADT